MHSGGTAAPSPTLSNSVIDAIIRKLKEGLAARGYECKEDSPFPLLLLPELGARNGRKKYCTEAILRHARSRRIEAARHGREWLTTIAAYRRFLVERTFRRLSADEEGDTAAASASQAMALERLGRKQRR